MDYKKNFKKQIKHYFLLKEIEKNIFLSYDENSNKICTIKVIKKNIEKNKLLQLRKEVDDFIKLQNNNLLNLISFEASSNNIYLIYEYCNGGNLKDFLNFYKANINSQLNKKLAQKIILQIIIGLEFLHKNKKIHGLLALENIFINFDKNENIANNGIIPEKNNISKELLDGPFTIKINNVIYQDDKNEMMKDINIIKNISPELAKDIKENENNYNNLTYESDIWSLGCIIFELIIGESAFNGESIEEIIDKIILGKYHLPIEISQNIDIISFINGFLQYFPKKRFNFDKIKEHNFLKKEPEEFFKIDNIENTIIKTIEINSKDCENILWALLALKKTNKDISHTNMIQKNDEINIINENKEINDNINASDENLEKTENLNIGEINKINIKEEDNKNEKEIINKNKINEDNTKEKTISAKKENKVKKQGQLKSKKNTKNNNNFEDQFEIINKYEEKKDGKKTENVESSYIEI